MKSVKNKNGLLMAVFAGFFIIVFFSVMKQLIGLWINSDDHSYGLFIIPISIYIMWQKKDDLIKTPIQSEMKGLIIVISALFLYLLSKFADILTLAPASMVLFIFGSVLFIFGSGMVKKLLFPLCFLFFIVPVPAQIYSALTIPLQLFVTKASVLIASMLGIPLFREGNVIHLPERTLEVVQACSGLRSLVSLLTLAVVFGYLSLKSNVLRTLLFISGLPVAVCVNILRVLLMIIAFHYLNLDLTKDSVHSFFGMIIFVVALIIIAIIRKVLVSWDKSVANE